MGKVLHLDTSMFFSMVIRDICKTYNFDYTFVKDSDSAMELIKNNKISLVISSIKLKKEDTEEFIKKIKTNDFEKIPILMISSDKRPEYREEVLNLGADYFVCKDLTFDTMIHKYMNKFKDSSIESKIS